MFEPLPGIRRLAPTLAIGWTLASLAAGPAQAADQQQALAVRKTGEGLHIVRFHTPQGEVSIYLPDDLAADDRLSGTVSYSPAGISDEQREANLGTLRGKVVEVAGQQVPEGGGWVAQVPGAPGPLPIRLRDPSGGRPVEAHVPVSPTPAEAPYSFGIPSHGQAGRSLPVRGPFTGDPADTRVDLGGARAVIVAQSPRQTVVLTPDDLAGPVRLRVEQGDTAAEGEVRILAVRLSAERLHLQRGERTTLHVEVRGLEGLAEPIPLQLTNETPAVVRLSEGDQQTVTIRPRDVPASGTLLLHRSVRSVRAGDFSINTALARPRYHTAPPQPLPIRDPAPCECEKVTIAANFDPKLKDPDRPKADFDAAAKKLTVTFAHSVKMSCQGDKGECTGEHQIVGVKGDRWWVRVPRQNTPNAWQAADDSISGEPAKAEAGVNGQYREVKKRCSTGKGATFEESRTASYVLDMSKLTLRNLDDAKKPAPAPTAISGRITFEVKTRCNGREATSTVVLRVDTSMAEVKAQPVGIDLALSDLDGDGQLDGCACTGLTVSLDAGKATLNAGAAVGARRLVTLDVPYTVQAACAHPQGGDGPCSGRFAVSSGPPDLRWSPQQPAIPIPGVLPSLTPEIGCSGTCKKPGEQKGQLTYKLALADLGVASLSGSLELAFDPTNTCGDSPKRTFKVELDNSVSKDKVKITESGN